MPETKQTITHNMQPPAGIMHVFSRLNYKPHYAIAEFVDNSTQSYFLHKNELESTFSDFKLNITIKQDPNTKTLTIEDNAFGMELDRFKDAVTLDAKNPEQANSRNEFGMGLKTAASWFGNVWSLNSTALGSPWRYKATVDIPYLEKTGENNIRIIKEPAGKTDHGTTIQISQLTKNMGSRSIGKTRSMLASMYRRDLASGDVSIIVNDTPITFESYQVLQFRERKWKKEIDFSFKFLEKDYRVTGFVGIMDPGSIAKAGFALFRRNRVVIGGEDNNYKPIEIFGNANSYPYQRLFGEINVEDFPINQAKDGFIWEDGLEDAFIDALKPHLKEYIQIANMSKKQRSDEERFSPARSKEVQKEVVLAINQANSIVSNSKTLSEDIKLNIASSDDIATFKAEMQEDNINARGFKSEKRIYNVSLDPVTNKTIYILWESECNDSWFSKKEIDNQKSEVTINVNHPFFKPYSNEDDFQVVLEKFVIAFVVAEEQAKLNTTKEGYISPCAIRNNINDYLKKLSED
jgi:hypothetical protein